VLDAVRVSRLGFACVDEVRHRVQQGSTGHRGRKHDPLFRVRRLLRRRFDRFTERGWSRILAGLEAGDVGERIGLAWIAAQELCLLFQSRSRYQAEQQLHRWFVHCADAEVPELRRLATTIDSWREELLAYFDTGGVSNGPTEATNALIKKIKLGNGRRRRTQRGLASLAQTGHRRGCVTGSTDCCADLAGRQPPVHRRHEPGKIWRCGMPDLARSVTCRLEAHPPDLT
jgi:transposase